jgi:DNA helicase HerA-like ATPase
LQRKEVRLPKEREMTLLPTSTNEPAGIRAASDRGLSLATAISGTPGSGKTTLAAVFALWGLLNGWGQVLIDPTGSLSTAFLQ